MIKFNSHDLDEFKILLESADNIYMASHISPDGDNLGSLLGLATALKNTGKEVHVIKVDETPSKYEFLPNINFLKDYDTNTKADLFISLDSGDLDRLGPAKDIALNANNLVNIDHHKTNPNYGDLNFVFGGLSSTGEIVYELLEALNIVIDKEIATLLYTAISTDTGSFIYSSTTSRTYEIAGNLLEKGIDFENLIIELYQSKSMAETNIFIDSIKTLEYHNSNKISFISVTEENIEKNKGTWNDTDGIIVFGRDIEGVEVSCVFKEYSKDNIKVSMRSKEKVDVSIISQAFGGGGHKRAGGCNIKDSLENAKIMVLKEIQKYI